MASLQKNSHSRSYYALWLLGAFFIGILGSAALFRGIHYTYGYFSKETSSSVAAKLVGESDTSSPAQSTSTTPGPVGLGSVSQFAFQKDSNGKVIFANLRDMTITLYEEGNEIDTFKIVSKGRPGTAWETPGGEYTIQTKEENHFSSIGKVWMPYSMQFFGNYFIHGWPYYSGGNPVGEGYSGGCIRLTTEDAQKVYEFSDVGTKVSIYGVDPSAPSAASVPGESFYLVNSSRSRPNVSALSYLVADMDSGDILMEKSRGMVLPIASISKLMTSLVSLDAINQYSTTTISKTAYETYGNAGMLREGEKILTGELLYPLLLESSNDAAEALAEFYGRKLFIRRMNDKAKAIGLQATSFEDPSGLSENNVSNAEDLFKLTRYIYNYKHFIFELTKKKTYQGLSHTWNNPNHFRSLEAYVGGKNGYTDEAGRTGIALFSLPLSEFENRTVVVILLKSNDRDGDIRSILNYLTQNITYVANKKISDV